MIDVRAVRELYRYNRWANARLFDAVSGLPREQFLKDLRGSFPSVRDTLAHVVSGEWLWLRRWTGTSPPAAFRATDFPRPDSLRARWSEVEVEQRAFVESVTAERLLSLVRYVNVEGQTWQYPLWRQMYHVLNHSSYHRGQLTTMLRQLGALPVPTDFLVFRDELGDELEGGVL